MKAERFSLSVELSHPTFDGNYKKMKPIRLARVLRELADEIDYMPELLPGMSGKLEKAHPEPFGHYYFT